MKLAFLFPPNALGPRTIDWTDPDRTGLTGTDQVCIKFAEQMARRGHDVTIYVERAPKGGGVWRGVQILEWEQWPGHATMVEWDAVIATSHAGGLKKAPASALRVVNRQVSVFVPGDDWEPGLDDYIDLYLCPSKAAMAVVSKDMPRPEKFRVLYNGHDPTGPRTVMSGVAHTGDYWPVKVPGRCVYISSPDRGLEIALQEWPHIRKAVPHATLKIFYYSLRAWIDRYIEPGKIVHSLVDHESVRRAHYVHHALDVLKHHGVEAVGGVSHAQMQEELAQAEVLAYPLSPLSFTETFGCAVLEACAHGAVPVISSADAFGELWGSACPHVDLSTKGYPARWTADETAAWRQLVIRVLTDEGYRAERQAAVRAHARTFTWEGQAAKLEAHLRDAIIAKKIPPPVTSSERPKLAMVLTRFAQGDEKIDPAHPFDRAGGGGAPTEFMGLAQAMPALGYDVSVYADFIARPQNGASLRYRDRLDGKSDPVPDILLAFYDTSILQGSRARTRIACHLTFRLPEGADCQNVSLNTAPSDYARGLLEPVYGGRWATLPNSVNPDLPPWNPVPGRVFSHISIDRGLHHTFRAWPLVRKAMPTATLHVVGAIEEWLMVAKQQSTKVGEWARKLSDAIPAALDAGGVELLGRLPRARLVAELALGACFAFPCDVFMPCETFSRSTMEALWLGMPCVLSAADAMESMYKEVAPFVPRTPEGVAGGIILALTGQLAHLSEPGKALARRHTYEANAAKLDAAIRVVMA